MLFFSFLNAGLLYLSAAALLPLLIWLLAKKKPRQVIFSSVRFLKQIQQQQKSRTQLKNILLLIIRMLIILLLILSAARPSLRIPRLKPAAKHPPTALAIVLDTSFSMDYSSGARSTLEHAKSAIEEINKRTNAQDIMVLITSDENWNRMHAQLFAGKFPENLLADIRSTWEPLPLEKMLTLASEKLKESQLTNREIYLLSDLPEQNLPATEIPTIVIPLPKPLPWKNISCQNAQPVMQLVDKKHTQLIRFDLINHGKSVAQDILVRVDFNGMKASEKFVTLQPEQKLTETMPLHIKSSGWQSGYIEVLDEKLAADNRCWFAFSFELNPSVAVITSARQIPLILQSMLSVYTGNSGEIKLFSPETVNMSTLKDYSLLIVYNTATLSVRLRQFLKDWQQEQRGILYIADANLSAELKSYYKQLFGLDFLSFQPSAANLTYVNPYHAITSMLDKKQIKHSAFRDFWEARTVAGANILLSAGSYPLALSTETNLLWLFDPLSANNPFFLQPAFPVFAYRCFQFAGHSGFDITHYTVGHNLVTDRLTLPDEKVLELGGSSFRLSEPGIYTQQWRGGKAQKISVRPDYTESSYKPLNRITESGYHILGAGWKNQIFLSRLGHDLWRILLYLVLVLFLLELVLVKREEWKRERKLPGSE